MVDFFTACPSAPDYRLDWQAISDRFACIANLADCPQDPIYHAEGDVWIHTRMVCEALLADPAWRALTPTAQAHVFTAALCHDIGKPACTREIDGRISSRGHSMLGAKMLREHLWRQALPFFERETLVNMVRFHQLPFYLGEKEGAERMVIKLSQLTRCDWLALLASADIEGRVSEQKQRARDNIDYFRLLSEEQGCRDSAHPFVDEPTRHYYLNGKWHQTDFSCPIQHRGWVTLLAGLPGAGKDTWVSRHGEGLPVVSLDTLRRQMGVAPEDNQGRVIQAAKEAAKEHLRAGRDFIWNATNITRDMRGRLCDLFARYHYGVHLVYIEPPSIAAWLEQNRARERAVPEPVLQRLLTKLEVPDPFECQRVSYIVPGRSMTIR